jgi:hypothetical protein
MEIISYRKTSTAFFKDKDDAEKLMKNIKPRSSS